MNLMKKIQHHFIGVCFLLSRRYTSTKYTFIGFGFCSLFGGCIEKDVDSQGIGFDGRAKGEG